MKKIFIFSLLLTLSCATSPTGRKQLILMGDSDMNQMGFQSFQELKKKTPIERDPEINAYVRCIALPITLAARGRTGVSDWEIVVFKDPTPNAFALPGGKIGVHTGILPVTKTDSQLAAVLGHEVGHVIARHGNERISQGEVTEAGLMIAQLASGSMDPNRKKLLMGSLGLGAQFGVLLPFSRAQESEADLIGLDLMANAGFDPRQSVELWKNMKAANGGKGPAEWMSTHPSDDRRMADLSAHIPAAMPAYESVLQSGRAPHCSLNRAGVIR